VLCDGVHATVPVFCHGLHGSVLLVQFALSLELMAAAAWMLLFLVLMATCCCYLMAG
jgi:hypothetical protein